jgi:hypothetical protein
MPARRHTRTEFVGAGVSDRFVRSLVELRVSMVTPVKRLNEEIGNMWGVLSRDVGNRG